ncbi:hypothetical protein HOP50_12g67140 [Chloropicon primus]|uniref:Centriolar and ciliogenesis-associated protein HYLS1 C-terminal domain-containing protein n=1 Tax=Chloropicon primus TaxID=1764295 RepID=A0A5B8MUZ6_9CHLO|nr:hypothetical protein A3770_12p66950 [Chloropicon primus]UPR03385.1 hypothetical protein HOP50_12g67140 [Chloropicon primus]|eukprot:QDZ24177.1 hypothetical protein A3770_12p66950 [Chloropicon primus]
MPTAVSVEAVRQQLEQMGRDVPEELISAFLKDLGVEPVSNDEAGSRESAFEEEEYEEDFEEDVYRDRIESLADESFAESKSPVDYKKAAGTRKENLSPLVHRYSHQRPTTSPGPRKGSGVPSLSPSRGLSARSANRTVPSSQGPPKTDRVARYQKTSMSWKTCSAAQLGKKSKPAVNYHKLFAAQHADAAKKTKRAVQSGRKKPVTREREFVIPTSKRRDNVRWEVRQSLRQTSTST